MALNRENYKYWTEAQFAAYDKQHDELTAARLAIAPAIEKADLIITAARDDLAAIAEELGIAVEIGGLTYYPKSDKGYKDFDKNGNVEFEDGPSEFAGGWYSSYETY